MSAGMGNYCGNEGMSWGMNEGIRGRENAGMGNESGNGGRFNGNERGNGE